MVDGTESQVSDDANADSPQGSDAHQPNALNAPNVDTDRVARIVAALRKAHAERATASAAAPAGAAHSAVATEATTDAAQTAELPDLPAPRRTASGVRPAVAAPPMPTLRWNPGARYRASRLAERPAVPAAPAAPVPAPPVPETPPVPGPPPLAGRLYRGPARRTGVFEREIWYPAARVPRDVGDALVRAVERYRTGSLSTSGLLRAIGRAHAA